MLKHIWTFLLLSKLTGLDIWIHSSFFHQSRVFSTPPYAFILYLPTPSLLYTTSYICFLVQTMISPVVITWHVCNVRCYPHVTDIHSIHSFIPLACAECDDFLPFSGTSSIPLSYVLFPATLLYQLFFHPLSPHLAIYFLVYLSILLFPNSYIILFWEFYFLLFSVHVQTNVIYLTLLSIPLQL